MNPIDRLLEIMSMLRHPVHGCRWDADQTFASIAPYTIEEAYEVADAIDHGNMDSIREELGDLLFQVVFYAQIAKEQGAFDFDAVATGIADKMVRRHPHVFGTTKFSDTETQRAAWEQAKALEREASGDGRVSVLDGIAVTLPAMTRAVKLGKRAAEVGFDWPDPGQIVAKIDEELGELSKEIEEQSPRERIEDELGDVLFTCVNLARKLNIDPERALKRTNNKFQRRFRYIEDEMIARGREIGKASIGEMEELWVTAKGLEPISS